MYNEETLVQIPNINLYRMLTYTFSDLKTITPADIGEESFEQVDQLLSMILLKGITRQFKKGLYKEYIEEEGLLKTLRGKIDMHKTIRLKTQVSREIYCHYNEFSTNNIYNQILKAFCLLILQRERLSNKVLKQFKTLLISFHEVDDISLDSVAWRKLSYEKNKFSYKMLIHIGHMIYRDIGVDKKTGKSFIKDKPFGQIYKQFIYRFFETECPHVKVSYEKVASEEEVDSDMFLIQGNKTTIVHTCFYPELFWHNQVEQFKPLLLQEIKKTMCSVMEYSKRLDTTVSGLLLYPSVEPTFIEAYVLEHHPMYVCTINLGEPMEVIKEHLRQMSQLG